MSTLSTFLDNEAAESDDENMSDEIASLSLAPSVVRQELVSETEDEVSDVDEEEVQEEEPLVTKKSSSEKRRRRTDEESSDEDDRLMEDDYELLEENLGIRFKKKFKRVKVIDDDDSDEEQAGSDARNKIADELFDLDDETEDQRHQQKRARSPTKSYSSEESSEDEIDDFIVDDSGAPTRRLKMGAGFTDARLQVAQDIFGADFDMNEFQDGRRDDEDDYSDEDEYPRRKSDLKKSKKKLQEIYEPFDLERLHFTKLDAEISRTDIPERIQRRKIPNFYRAEFPIKEEAVWIFDELQKMKKQLGPAYENETLEDISNKFDTKNENGDNVFDIQGLIISAVANTAIITDSALDDVWEKESTTMGAKKTTGLPVIVTASASKTLTEEDNEKEWDNASTVCQSVAGIAPHVAKSVTGTGDDDDWETSSFIGPTTATAPPASNQATLQETELTNGSKESDWEDESVVTEQTDKEDESRSDFMIIDKPEEIRKNAAVICKIESVLRLMKFENLEVPCIARYRKDTYMPELTVKDLWNICRLDVNYCQLHKSKNILADLLSITMEFMEDEANKDYIESLIGTTFREITANDFDVLLELQSVEEINDFRSSYALYYGAIAAAVKNYGKEKKRLAVASANEKSKLRDEGENDLVIDLNAEKNGQLEAKVAMIDQYDHQKRPCVGRYEHLKKNLGELIPKFGMSAADFAENVRCAYAKISPKPATEDHLQAAALFTSQKFPSRESVMDSAIFVMATQLSRELEIRKVLRDHLWEKGGFSVTPTETGIKLIDEAHTLYSMKYLRNKPVRKFVRDEFLKLICGEQDKLIEIRISQEYVDSIRQGLVEEWIGYFNEDGFSGVVEGWNAVKRRCVEQTVFEMILPSLVKELKLRLEKESKQFVVRTCKRKIRNFINVGTFQFCFDSENPEEDDVPAEWSTERGIRVMAIAYDSNPAFVPFACVLNPDGSIGEHIALNNIVLFSKPTPHDLQLQASTVALLRNLITETRPHVVVIGAENFRVCDLEHEVKEVLLAIHTEEEEFPLISVEVVDNDAAKVYSSCNRAVSEFRDHPAVLRQAISLGRRLIDPLVELGQLFNPDEDILCLKFHPMQEKILKEELLEAIEEVFVSCVNDIGLNFNRCLADSRTAQLLQFVAGLGPSKAAFLMQVFTRKPSNLKNRNQLKDVGMMGPCVYYNCAGFIKVLWREFELGEQDETFIEYLDCTRVHPDQYLFARQIAADAFAIEDEDGNPIETNITEDEYVKIVLDDPVAAYPKIQALSMVDFVQQLVEKGHPILTITLEDIATELTSPFKDPRRPYISPSMEELFNILTKETAETLYNGKLVVATVVGFCSGCRLPDAEPEKVDDGNWRCPVCKKEGFENHDKVYDHYDTPRGVYLRIDNGLKGYISVDKLSDQIISDISTRVCIGQPVHCRVLDFNICTRKMNLTSKGTDLRDESDLIKPRKDLYYDKELEAQDQAKIKKAHSGRACTQYTRRPIMHPCFHNISYSDCAARMESMEVGDAIFRPSSKGTDHITLSWKITSGLLNHVDILELGKTKNELSLGRVLVVDGEEYEDLDEILTRYVYRISINVREILNHKSFVDVGDGGKHRAEEILKNRLTANAYQLHYVFSIFKQCPGRFILSYLLSVSRMKFAHETITVMPDGYRYRGETHESLIELLRHFKVHYRDPPSNATPSQSMTPSTTRY